MADAPTRVAPSTLAALLVPYGRITSAHRSAAHNRAVGGVANSYHLIDRAVDVARGRGVAHWQVAAFLRSRGYHLIESLDEGDHSHFAFGVRRARPVSVSAAVRSPAAFPSEPSQTVLLADDHGTLNVDLPKTPALTAAEGRD